MSTVNETSVVEQVETILHRRVGPEALLYRSETDHMVALDPVGALVWEGLAYPGTVGELAADLADAFEVPAEDVVGDVIALLADLVALGMARTDADDPDDTDHEPA